jgi:hypothetical protein
VIYPPADIEELIAQLPTLAEGQEPAPYPFEVIEERGEQDDFEGLGAPGDSIRTPAEAIRLGHQLDRDNVHVGIGYCLREVRGLYGAPPLAPDAETAWEQADRRHFTSTIPWGPPVFWVNGGFGHIAISLGRNRCLTTDYVATGQWGVAPISALAPWCRGRLAGYSNDLNGVDVWEPRKRKPKPWGIEQRAQVLRNTLQRAIDNEAPQRRIDGLRRWVKQIEKNIEKEK